jgi:uncharacterized protein YyaL (SSP411 family)
MGELQFRNALAEETSPYLLQHAHNPVNWYPWGDAAFALARDQNRPVFLSIGYSTCYWCHVMERESFENDSVAAVLNENFVAIKVDREERPEIDERYMLATQLLTGRGGWPNSLWLMPDGRPWMAGTYYPPDAFQALLRRLAEIWHDDPQLVERQAAQISEAMAQASTIGRGPADAALDRRLVERVLAELERTFDRTFGGFGGAPKFPPHAALRLLVYELSRGRHGDALRMLVDTLDAMWRGGIHDHVGGGFHRYATDRRWLVPHFEKMLYDNAQLLRLYADAYGLTRKAEYRAAAAGVVDWLTREMTHRDGAFYSAIDAGQVGQEGVFYVWSYQEILDALGEEEGRLVASVYGALADGNWIEEASGHRPGTNILHLAESWEAIGQRVGMEPERLASRLAAARARLLAVRNQRPFPHVDDKILAGWNGLVIGALARAGAVFEEARYVTAAERAARFVMDHMTDDGRVLRSWRSGRAQLAGYLDDYAYLGHGLVELHQATSDAAWLAAAERVAQQMLETFEDRESGGFFYTGPDHDRLIPRSKNLLGGGNIPSASAAATQLLLTLGALTGRLDYTEAPARALTSLAGLLAHAPLAGDDLILAAAQFLDRSSDVVLAGSSLASGQGATDQADVSRRAAPVSIRARVKPSRAAPGERLELAVHLDIDRGWHLYGPGAPSKGFGIPTSLTLADESRISVERTDLPAGNIRHDRALGRDVAYYEDQVWLRMTLRVRSDVPSGPAALRIVVAFQACDERACAVPQRVEIDVPFEIAGADS